MKTLVDNRKRRPPELPEQLAEEVAKLQTKWPKFGMKESSKGSNSMIFPERGEVSGDCSSIRKDIYFPPGHFLL